MFCKSCGAENTDSAKFCKGCGQPLITVEKKIKTKSKRSLVVAAIAVVVIILGIFVWIRAASTINLNDYLTIEVTGYNGYGEAFATIDWVSFAEKNEKKISMSADEKAEYGSLLNLLTETDAMQGLASVELRSSEQRLSNGDEIEYVWNVNENLFSHLNCKVKYKNGTYEVSGLEEVKTFDAFADLEVVVSGVEPNGTADISYNGNKMSEYDFCCEKSEGLSNGDVISVVINSDNLDYYAADLGMLPETLEKEYIVSGLSSYLTSVSDLRSEDLALLQQQAEDVYRAHIAKNWDDDESLESLAYIGNYLLIAKNSESWCNNEIYIVYKAQVRNQYSYDGDLYDRVNDIYWYAAFDDLLMDEHGILNIDPTEYSTPDNEFTVDSGISSDWWGTKAWSYDGYPTIDEMYKDIVASNMDVYYYEDNVDAKTAVDTGVKQDVDDTEDPDSESGYIFPNSDSEELTEDDLEGMTAWECKIARNEIYARHGRKFKDEELQTYFNGCDWYEGTVESDDFQESDLNDIEIANRDLIVDYEKEQGYR